MSIELAVWRWNPKVGLPRDVKALHAALDRGEGHPAMVRFDATRFEDALRALYERAGLGEGPWRYEVVDPGPGRANWVRFHVDIGVVHLFAPRLVEICCVHELVVSDPHNEHIVGA